MTRIKDCKVEVRMDEELYQLIRRYGQRVGIGMSGLIRYGLKEILSGNFAALGFSKADLIDQIKIENQRSGDHGHIYFVRSTRTGLVKIGRSVNVTARMKTLEHEFGERLELLHLVPSDDCVVIERQYHQRFDACRGRGEWFALTDADLAALQAETDQVAE